MGGKLDNFASVVQNETWFSDEFSDEKTLNWCTLQLRSEIRRRFVNLCLVLVIYLE